jgi:hypothetical protein
VKGGNPAARQRPPFTYQGFVVAGPSKCLGQFSLRRTRRHDLGYQRFIHRPKDGDDIVGSHRHIQLLLLLPKSNLVTQTKKSNFCIGQLRSS